ncbi:MAG: type II secretion system F family protein [Gammaproteobacteria bacterium]|nr:type II secretion system F family protein [Gammaproteobacteria bacterium]
MALELTQGPSKPEASAAKTLFGSRGQVGAADRLFLAEQLALMLENGMNLHAALTGLARQTARRPLRELIEALAQQVEAGKSFSYALSQHPEVFDTTWISLIAASENGGFMHEVLVQLTRSEEKQNELRNHLVSSMSYPAFLVLFSLAVVIFVLVVVFPKFGTMFVAIRDQLPVTTLGLMWASNLLIEYWIYILGGLAAAFWAAKIWMDSEPGRARLDGWKLSVPGVRQIAIELYLVQSFRVFGLSLGNGVNVSDALESCRDVVANVRYREFIVDVERRVQEGGGISGAFENTEFIPPLVRQMVSTGEETGNLAAVLNRIADFYERELTRRLDRVSKLAEPVMLLVMGLVVGILVSSLILPIFKLSRAVG